MSAADFIREISLMPGGEAIKACIQCGTCSASCPNANLMEYSPRKIIAMARAGMKEEVLRSNSMWYCLSCQLCTVRCPRNIKPAEIMHTLECLSVKHSLDSRRTRTSAMYKAFVDSIKTHGRVYELGFMLEFCLKTNPFALFGMMGVGIDLFLSGRLALPPEKTKRGEKVKAILERAQSLKEAQ
jgi:heterodisulfide reductase subunit C